MEEYITEFRENGLEQITTNIFIRNHHELSPEMLNKYNIKGHIIITNKSVINHSYPNNVLILNDTQLFSNIEPAYKFLCDFEICHLNILITSEEPFEDMAASILVGLLIRRFGICLESIFEHLKELDINVNVYNQLKELRLMEDFYT